MDDLNKDEHNHDRETQKKLPHQPLSSSNSVFSEMKFPSIGPAIAGIYMQTHQEVAKGATTGSFPSAISFNLIFLTAALISVISITLVIILRRKITQSQSTLKLEIESSVKKRDALSRVVSIEQQYIFPKNRNFSICKSCLWCASFLDSDVTKYYKACPSCNDTEIEFMPISSDET